MEYAFNFSFLAEYWPGLLAGFVVSVQLAALSLIGGFLLGVILAVARNRKAGFVRYAAAGFVDATRNTPLLIQTFWLFFGLSALGIHIPAFYTAIVALVINTSGYTCEIVRSGIDSLPTGQWEAAACLGLSRFHVLRYIVLPQAIEKMYPSLVSQFVLMMLATSIMTEISVRELTGVGLLIQSWTFRGFEAYLVIAAIYLIMSWALRVVMMSFYHVAFPKKRRISNYNRKRGKIAGTSSIPTETTRVIP